MPEDLSWSHFFLLQENVFHSFRNKFSLSFYVISLARKISYFLSGNHNIEFWCVICTGVTLFALQVLRLNCTALSQSESSNFFMDIIRY